MPLSDTRSPPETDDDSAPKKRRAARSKADADTAQASDAPAAGAAKKPVAAKKTTLAKTADKLAKLGLTRDIDLVLHLPMRYEDETSLTPIGELLPGGISQTEGVVYDNEIAYVHRMIERQTVPVSDDMPVKEHPEVP